MNDETKVEVVEEKEPETNPIIMVGGDALDLNKLPPLTLGHKRALFKQGLNLGELVKFTPEQEFQFVWFIVKLLRPQTTEAEAENIELSRIMDIVTGTFNVSKKAANRPFSAP